jgi:hypothetical protein
MANTKISQLPSYTGTAADIRWFVMNNSGETETYKYSGYSGQLIKGTGTSGYRTPTSLANGNNAISIGTTDASGANDIMIGSGTNYTASQNSIGIGRGVYMLASPYSINIGENCANQGSYTIVIGSTYGGKTSRSMAEAAITIGNGNQNNQGYRGVILGNLNNIGAGTNYNVIIGNNSSVDGGSYNTIIGGNNNTISGTTSGSTLIGFNNYTEPLQNDTAYVNNLQVLRTPSTRVQSVSSGTTFTCNLDNGAKSQFYITGTSTINITNVRDGASFMIKTQTDGNYVMTWTATGGYTFLFEGGTKDPGNNIIDIFQFEVFGNVIYGSRKHNFI